jgi:hypothetical protein
MGQVSVGNWAYHHGKYLFSDVYFILGSMFCVNWLALIAIKDVRVVLDVTYVLIVIQ